jgi:hypothetical protein
MEVNIAALIRPCGVEHEGSRTCFRQKSLRAMKMGLSSKKLTFNHKDDRKKMQFTAFYKRHPAYM